MFNHNSNKSSLGYGGGVPAAQFFAPAFTLRSDDNPEPNYIIFRNAGFIAGDPDTATVLGHLADVSGIPEALGMCFEGNWALVEMTSGPFFFSKIRSRQNPNLEMKIAVLQGPILDRALRAAVGAEPETEPETA